jgi:hypothetical protein
MAEIVIWGADNHMARVCGPMKMQVMDKSFEGVNPAIRQQVVFDRYLEMFQLDGPGGTYLYPTASRVRKVR